jgi:exopolyphosphatase / guanosine-5'-triphosphate,3'-diphosphate pyrophosphatase
MILAGIDIGTNSLRLLIADSGPGYFRKVISDREMTRLGQELDRCGVLAPEAMERALEALVAFHKSIQRQGAYHISAIGTSALRRAKNASVFIDRVQKQTGIVVRIISGEEEARLTLLGVEQSLATPNGMSSDDLKRTFVLDIGGGSTEIILTTPDKNPAIASLSLGAVYLHDQFIKHDPPTPEELARLRDYVHEELNATEGILLPVRNSICIGTAGTITTLAAMSLGLVQYVAEKINRVVLTREFISTTVTNLEALTLEERKKIRGLESGREDIILSGAIIAQEIMKRFGFYSMAVSDRGLLEGIVIDLSERLNKRIN